MVEVTRYTVGISFQFDQKEQRKLDNKLKTIEAQLTKFGSKLNKSFTLNIDRFVVDQNRLNITLGNALDVASTRNVFEISRFAIDQTRLSAMMRGAVQRASAASTANIGTNVRAPRAMGSVARSAGLGGAIGGGIARLYAPALALGAGGYGLSQLNQRNQQVVAAQLQTQATVQQFGGTQQQGVESFDWLRAQANRIGFNYLDAAADYNKLTAGLMGSGFSLGQSQDVFKGFAELSRVNKLDRTTQNRLFRALSQVAGKDQLMSEELTGQIAEALPGGVSVFAEAYRRQTGKDLGLGGSEDIKLLLKAMKDRKVKGDILTFAADVAAERAAPGLSAAQKASQAEQARFQNVTSDMAILASNAGVEEGFARIFRTLNQGLSESGPMIERLARGFNEATKWADDLLLFPQSFARALEGRDSLVADSLFPSEEDRKVLFDFLGSFKTAISEIGMLVDNIKVGWSAIISLIDSSDSLAKLTNALNIIANSAGVFNSLAAGDYTKAFQQSQGAIASTAKLGFSAVPGVNLLDAATGGFVSKTAERGLKSFANPAEFESDVRGRQSQALADLRRDQFPLISPYPVSEKTNSQVPNVTVEMTVNVASAAPEDFGEAIKAKTQEIWETAMLQFPVKE